ncbi:hypothetical protein Tco_0976190 [Tanacetum coccineum]|uniref:Uncharacterized protein n=1 Tax=Tanacetum coccineum TaxID=301880 RepID=A0ABQ5EGU8_9ASTR
MNCIYSKKNINHLHLLQAVTTPNPSSHYYHRSPLHYLHLKIPPSPFLCDFLEADLKEVDGVSDQLPLFMGSTHPNSQLTHSLLEPLETMYNEATLEFIVDESMYYPSTANYGYICTGCDWDDHHRFFGVDGQNVQFMRVDVAAFTHLAMNALFQLCLFLKFRQAEEESAEFKRTSPKGKFRTLEVMGSDGHSGDDNHKKKKKIKKARTSINGGMIVNA